MDCLRSFSFATRQNSSLSGGQIKQWFTGAAQHFWSSEFGGNSTIKIQGFKNIDIYGIDVIGSVQTLTSSATGGVIVNDWYMQVAIDGSLPLVSGENQLAPNYWLIDSNGTINKSFALGKYTNSVKFATPFTSVKNISLLNLISQGTAYQTLTDINLNWDLNFVVYYKYEGE